MRTPLLLAMLVTLGLATAIATVPARAQMPPPPVDGARLYVTAGCAYCHETNGEGGWNGEKLAGNRNVAIIPIVVSQILFGGAFMPAHGDELTDEEVAAVANYIRNSWGNSFADPITVDYVAQMRGPLP